MPSNDYDNWDSLREKIIGLGERSVRKSYYPELQQQIAELKRFRELLDQSNDVIFLLEMPSCLIMDVNRSALDQLGYTRDEVLNISINDLITPWEIDQMEKLFSDLMENRGIPDRKNVVTTFLKSNLEEIPVEISISLVEFGDNFYAVIVARDITERMEAQRAIMQSEEKYRILFEYSPDFIILINPEGKIIDINKSTKKFVNLSKEQLIGKSILGLGVLFEEDVNEFMEIGNELINGESVEPFEFKVIDRNGKICWMDAYLSLLKKDNGDCAIQIILHDITKRKNYEKQIKQSLSEKEILLKEIHHRVKNNLQIISSLLNLQSRYIEDKDAFGVFKESQNRIKSMALIHEKLYQSEDLTKIDFAEYIKSLTFHLFRSYSIDQSRVELSINFEGILFDIDTSIPCGLIINELISNSLKYAFPNGRKGKISIDLQLKGEKDILIIRDNGVGFPEGMDFQNTETLGLRLVNILVNQINGVITCDKIEGTSFRIEFTKLAYKERI
ncbi:sensor histidine kinase [Methanobacterium sp.]|uniref:sensor histidine kinase n=1 Tax=Methanobacterium sp. TaxID=2164 RepID=UPI003C71B399